MQPLQVLVKSLYLSYKPPLNIEGQHKVSPKPFLQAKHPQLSQPPFTVEVLQPSVHFHGPPLDPLSQVHVFVVLGTQELDTVLQVGSHKSREEGGKITSHVCNPGYDRLPGLQVDIASSCTIFHPPVHPSPSLQGCSQPLHSPVCTDTGDYPRPGTGTWHLTLFNFTSFTRAHFSHPSMSFQTAPLPSSIPTVLLSLVSSANLLRVHSILLSMSLLKIVNSIDPSTCP